MDERNGGIERLKWPAQSHRLLSGWAKIQTLGSMAPGSEFSKFVKKMWILATETVFTITQTESLMFLTNQTYILIIDKKFAPSLLIPMPFTSVPLLVYPKSS